RKAGPSMSEWQRMCRGVEGLSVDGTSVVVSFANERRHRVEVHDCGDTYQLMGIVARPAALEGIPDVAIRVWERNRATPLVGFRRDQKGRLIGDAWIPKAGLRREELLLYVQHVAAECDRVEYLLTGKDRE